MASFDVTDSAMKGYSFIWSERRYLLKLAIFPLFIKFVCMTVIMNGYDFDFIKQSLLMLPSYFADGWVMSHLVRLIFLGQRWPFRPTGNPQSDMAMLRDRAGGIMAGTVFFALIEFIKTGLTGIIFMTAPPGSLPGNMPGQTAPVADPSHVSTSPYTAIAGMFMIIVTIWAVRYLWLYIPAAAGFSGRAFLRSVGGLMGSIRLLGVWMICTIPTLFGFVVIANIFMAPFHGAEGGLPQIVEFIMNIGRVIIIMLTTMITTAGMSYVIRNMFEQTKA